jgi:ABC-type transport system involved in multi-copper enzyme maturation permease subunit
MNSLRSTLTIAHLTLHEAARRRVLVAALICGVAFLVLFAVGFHFIVADVKKNTADVLQLRMVLTFFVLAGLYATNFLTVMTAVLLPVDTLSGEIDSGVMQTVASKPLRRSDIVLGKWIAYVLIVTAYLLLLAGGVILTAHLRAGIAPPNIHIGLPLMALEVMLLTTNSIAGGTRFSTVTNGVLAFGLFGLAFLGGWVEQIGTFTSNASARNIGTIASLVLPSEALWRMAAYHMQSTVVRDLGLTPFSPVSIPTVAMVWWAAGYIVVAMALALRRFATRPL